MSIVHTVNAKIVGQWLKNHEAILIDVREEDEHKQEHIQGSLLIPLSSFDKKRIPREDKKVVFHCRSGKRSAEAANHYNEECYNLEGGILGWKKEGLATCYTQTT